MTYLRTGTLSVTYFVKGHLRVFAHDSEEQVPHDQVFGRERDRDASFIGEEPASEAQP